VPVSCPAFLHRYENNIQGLKQFTRRASLALCSRFDGCGPGRAGWRHVTFDSNRFDGGMIYSFRRGHCLTLAHVESAA